MNLKEIILNKKKNKNKTRRKKKIKKKKNKNKCVSNKKKETIKECLKKHILIHVTFIGCFYVLSKRFNKNIFVLLGTLIFASFTGYLVHIISHLIYYTDVYNKTDNILKHNKYTDLIMKKVCRFMDFHRITHHDSKVNKKKENILYEAINNAFFQGLGLIILIHFIKKVDYIIIVFWVLFYITVHNINLLYIPSWSHKDHHEDALTNISFGFDFYDLIFGTGVETEYRPDIVINIITITALLYYTVPYFMKIKN